uniref:CLIP domain-containing serine protease n=1 Tax=Anopheles farauti TaxID=69004 RepID=A0A182QKU4_9DIPT
MRCAHFELLCAAFLLLGSCFVIGQQQLNQACILPNLNTGRCVPLNDCPEIVELVEGNVVYPGQTNRVHSVLRGCGSNETSSDPIVCCESPRLPGRRTVDVTTVAEVTTTSTTTTTTRRPSPKSTTRRPTPTTTRRPTPAPTLPTTTIRYDHFKDLLPERCGEESPGYNVFSDVEDEDNKHVWAVFLEIRRVSSNTTGRCVGTLIHERFVLTAAHCLHTTRVDSVRLQFGVNRLSKFVECLITDECQERTAAEFIIHHGYNSHTSANDIALVRVSEPVLTGADTGIIPACLPLDHLFDETLADDPSVLSLGWGETRRETMSDRKMIVLLNVLSQEQCARQLRNSNRFNASMLYSVMCTVGVNPGQDVCQGDSGAPLLQIREKRAYVVGVVSIGPKCGTSPAATISTRVSEYRNWILTNMKQARQ